jgi:hypothetical protein
VKTRQWLTAAGNSSGLPRRIQEISKAISQ